MPTLELDSISIKGFKSIASVEKLKLGHINLLIGANGTGKSNFIEAFSFLHAIRGGKLENYVAQKGGAEKLLHFGRKVTKKIELKVSFRDEINGYEISLSPSDADTLIPIEEAATFWNPEKGHPDPLSKRLVRARGEAGISDSSQKGEVIEWVRKRLDRWRLYHFHDTSAGSAMKQTADLEDNRFLRSDGSNLASFLYYLQVKETASYELIRRTVQQVAPFFDDFQLAPSLLNPTKIRLEWRHKNSDAYFDASSFSDGTLRFIALATLFLQPPPLRPSVILVDEAELGLHPYAIAMLGALIKATPQDTQVILSTQSPLLLDQFGPENVLVAERKAGATEFSRLNTADLESWLDDYSLGQLWEKNEIGGRPA